MEILKILRKINFKTYLAAVIFSLFITSCSKEKSEIPEAINQLIKNVSSESANCTCDPYINQYLWRDKTVYVLAFNGPACDTFPIYYDENGNIIAMASGYTFDSFLRESSLIKNIWTCGKHE